MTLRILTQQISMAKEKPKDMPSNRIELLTFASLYIIQRRLY